MLPRPPISTLFPYTTLFRSGTEDDMPFRGIDEVRIVLGLNEEQFKQLNGLVSFKDPVLRVVSVGTAGRARRTVQMVFRRVRSEEHTSELQSHHDLVCRLLLE